MRTLLLAALLTGAAGAASLDGARFSPPGREWSLRTPDGWRRSFGKSTLVLRPSGADERAVRFRVEERRGDAKRFADKVAADAGKLGKTVARVPVTIDGRAGERLELVETEKVGGRYGKLPGPLRECYVVVPRAKGFLVLAWEGFGEEYARRKPELEAIVASLRLAPAKPAR